MNERNSWIYDGPDATCKVQKSPVCCQQKF